MALAREALSVTFFVLRHEGVGSPRSPPPPPPSGVGVIASAWTPASGPLLPPEEEEEEDEEEEDDDDDDPAPASSPLPVGPLASKVVQSPPVPPGPAEHATEAVNHPDPTRLARRAADRPRAHRASQDRLGPIQRR
jgi:hypothetical protein